MKFQNLFSSFFQVEIGKKRKQNVGKAQKKTKHHSSIFNQHSSVRSNVEQNSRKSQLWPGEFVALRLVKYNDEEPQIAKIESVSETDVVIQWWTGLYHGVWTEWKVRSKVVTETVPKNAVIKSGF